MLDFILLGKMEDGDMESYQISRLIQDSVFLCRKMGSINHDYFW